MNKLYIFLLFLLLFSCGVQVVESSLSPSAQGAFTGGSFRFSSNVDDKTQSYLYQWTFDFTDSEGTQVSGCQTAFGQETASVSAYISGPVSCSSYQLSHTYSEPIITPVGVYGPFIVNYCLVVKEEASGKIVNEEGVCSEVATGPASPQMNFNVQGFNFSTTEFNITSSFDPHICSELDSATATITVNSTQEESWTLDDPTNYEGSTWTATGAYANAKMLPGPMPTLTSSMPIAVGEVVFRINHTYKNPNCSPYTKAIKFDFGLQSYNLDIEFQNDSPTSLQIYLEQNYDPFGGGATAFDPLLYSDADLSINGNTEQALTLQTISPLNNSEVYDALFSVVLNDAIYPEFSGVEVEMQSQTYIDGAGDAAELEFNTGAPVLMCAYGAVQGLVADPRPIPGHFSGESITSATSKIYDLEGNLVYDIPNVQAPIAANHSHFIAPPSGGGKVRLSVIYSSGYHGFRDYVFKLFDWEVID